MTEIVPVGEPLDDDVIERAAEKLEAGVPIAIPTDTVYALVADPSDPGATDRLFALRGRSRGRDLSVFVASVDQAVDLTTALPKAAVRLMEAFWPGSLTLVVPRDPELEWELGEDDITIGLRVPDHPVPLVLCEEVGPLASTLAGVQGQRVYETAGEVAEGYGARVSLVLDGGRCGGPPVTVVDATGDEPKLVRAGGIAWAEIERAF